eukprot:scaffold9080_cov30-Tisochrysis_lutea.AAC.1
MTPTQCLRSARVEPRPSEAGVGNGASRHFGELRTGPACDLKPQRLATVRSPALCRGYFDPGSLDGRDCLGPGMLHGVDLGVAARRTDECGDHTALNRQRHDAEALRCRSAGGFSQCAPAIGRWLVVSHRVR